MTADPVMTPSSRPEPGPSSLGFGTDLAWAARALRRQPSVALVSLAVALLPGMLDPTRPVLGFVFGFPISVFGVGWYGAERIFFRDQFEGTPVRVADLIRTAPRFIGRFLRLA